MDGHSKRKRLENLICIKRVFLFDFFFYSYHQFVKYLLFSEKWLYVKCQVIYWKAYYP